MSPTGRMRSICMHAIAAVLWLLQSSCCSVAQHHADARPLQVIRGMLPASSASKNL